MDTRAMRAGTVATLGILALLAPRPGTTLARWIKGDKPDDLKTNAEVD
jgi:hypothetical protein